MKTQLMSSNYPPARQRQRGVALPLVAAGLLAMLAIVGLALDTSHALANKTRLQSSADAAALAAAKKYDEVADIFAGNAAAYAVFGLNADGVGNHELNAAYDAGEVSVVVQWSETLNPFVSSGLGPYVRVIATGLDLDTSLSAVLGIVEIEVAASAVAGPSPTIQNACNVAPLIVCARDLGAPPLFGFVPGELDILKSASGDPNEIGPGNFYLARLGCPGGNCVRENLAGGYDGCLEDGEVDTEPGNTVGPTVQGLNTRFYQYSGPLSSADYKPDVQIQSSDLTYDGATDTILQNGVPVDASTIDYSYADYVGQITGLPPVLSHPPPLGMYDRRVLALPLANCSVDATGQSTLEVVGFGCYFMLQPVVQQGTEAQIFGQFINGCTAGGISGIEPGAGPSPYLIQLYKDPDSDDS